MAYTKKVALTILFNGAISEEDLLKEIELPPNKNLSEIIQEINNKNQNYGLKIDSTVMNLDKKTYYGFQNLQTSNNDILKKSFSFLNSKQILFAKLFLKLAIKNFGLISYETAINVRIQTYIYFFFILFYKFTLKNKKKNS